MLVVLLLRLMTCSGDVIIDAKGVTKAYGDKLLMNNLDFSIPPGAIVGGTHYFCLFVCLFVCLDADWFSC